MVFPAMARKVTKVKARVALGRTKPLPVPAKEFRLFDALELKLARALVRVTVGNMDAQINLWLKRIGIAAGLDRSTIAEINPTTGQTRFTHGWARKQSEILSETIDANRLLPWTIRKMLGRETIVMPSLDTLPGEAAVDRESFRRYGTKSNIIVPIEVDERVIGAMSFASLSQPRSWSPRLVRGFQGMAEIFGYAVERKRAIAERIKLRSELMYVSRVTTMGEFAAAIAHELNQPLAAILSNAESVQTMLMSDQLDLDEIKTIIDDIVQDDNRAVETISRLRPLFRRDTVLKSKVDLSEVLHATGQIVRADALRSGISFALEMQEPLPLILAERVQLQQAIINLVSNAFDAVTEIDDGPRTIRLGTSIDGPDNVRIFVSDSGNGIAPEMMPRVFESFFTTKPNGMGMGLAIAKSIVEAHGGRLSASPNANRGTTFEIRLPVSERGREFDPAA